MSIILRQSEKLIKVVRRHKMFITPVFFSWPLFVVGLLFFRYFLGFIFFGYWILALMIVSLVVTLIILRKLYIWKNNALIITNQRVIKNEQRGFFSKKVTELLYDDIMEISYDKEGLAASLYDYGDLKIRTASENEVVVREVAKPDETVELINQIRQELSGHV